MYACSFLDEEVQGTARGFVFNEMYPLSIGTLT